MDYQKHAVDYQKHIVFFYQKTIYFYINVNQYRSLTISHRRGEVITSLYSLSRRRIECRFVITEHEVTNCFSINFQVFTNDNQLNFTKIHFLFSTV